MRFRAASDQALLVYLGEEIGLRTHQRVVRLLRLLQREPLPWVRNLQPAYCSLLVSFDACVVDHAQVETALRSYEKRAQKIALPAPRLVEIPVCYGGEFGPDMEKVAAAHRLKPERIIELHSSQTYHAYFLGFAPGFAYLGDLPDSLATPRLATPRKKVPAGSVGVAGKQTAMYPFATPGGWNLLGRTPLRMFQLDREPMELVDVGDEVRFRPITPQEFSALEPR
ncbi:MAG TPA: 5-oxoprolinase subunit PxpB [Candidatus Acidoferrum sp.]